MNHKKLWKKTLSFILALAVIGSMPFNILAIPLSDDEQIPNQEELLPEQSLNQEDVSPEEPEIQSPEQPSIQPPEQPEVQPPVDDPKEDGFISINGQRLEPNTNQIVWFNNIESYEWGFVKRNKLFINGSESDISQLVYLSEGKYQLNIVGSVNYFYTLGIDKTFPEVSTIYNPYTDSLFVSATDELSGIAGYYLNNLDTVCTSDEYGVVTSVGGVAEKFFVEDNAGNITESVPAQYPLAVNTNGYVFDENIPAGNPVTLVPSLNDNGRCPTHKFQYSKDGGSTWIDMQVNGNILINNTYGIEEYIVRAVCDNESQFEISRQTLKVNVDTEVPEEAEVIIKGNKDENGAYTEIPEIIVTAENTASVIISIDGNKYPLSELPAEVFSEGEHKFTVIVTDTAGNQSVTPEYEIYMNAVKPEIKDISVESIYSVSDDRKSVSCFEDMKISYSYNDEVISAVLTYNGEDMPVDMYTQNGNSFIINKEYSFTGKIGIRVTDAEGSDITYYLGNVTESNDVSFYADSVTDVKQAITVIYDNSSIDAPEISVSQGEKSIIYNKNSENISWIALENDDEITASFTEYSVNDKWNYQYKHSEDEYWSPCGENVTIDKSGKYQFRKISDDGISTKITEIYFINSEIFSVVDNESHEADFWNTSSKTVEIFNTFKNDEYDSKQPVSYVHCDIYVDVQGYKSLKVGYVTLSSEGVCNFNEVNAGYVSVTGKGTKASIELKKTGVYKFHHWTTDTYGNTNDISGIKASNISSLNNQSDIESKTNIDIVKLQLEAPVIMDFEIEGEKKYQTQEYIETTTSTMSINPMNSVSLFLTSADLSTLSYNVDFGLCGASDEDSVVLEYKRSISDEWKPVTGGKLPDNNVYDIRITAKNKAGITSQMTSSKVIIDTKSPLAENNSPEIIAKISGTYQNGFYSGDVTADISVKDPETNKSCSGLSSVAYWINDNSTGETLVSEELFVSENPEYSLYENIQKNFSDTVTIPSSYNGDLTLYVSARDNSGNAKFSSTDIMIDTVNPEITVEYDNNSVVNDIFTSSRTAYITVHEANFNEEDVQITAETIYGNKIGINGWSHSGNYHTATVTFAGDGEYVFDVSYTDKAGNEASVNYNCIQPNSFEIDATIPELSVRLDDGEEVISGSYNSSRTAYVTVKDKNLDLSTLENSGFKVTHDGRTIDVEYQKTHADSENFTYEFAIPFSDDGDYTFSVTAQDTAGHIISTPTYNLTIDTVSPEIKVTGFEKANNGSIVPVIELSDINLDNDKVKITLEGANSGSVGINKSDEKENGYRKVEIYNFEDASSMDDDDLYTLNVFAEDTSGNQSTQTCQFTINRTGPVYVIDSSLGGYLNNYNQEAKDIIVRVYDINEIISTKINVVKDGNIATALNMGAEYDESDAVQEDNLYMYEYTIKASNFEDNGNYNVIVTSKDTASNNSDNTAVKLSVKLNESAVENESAEIRFTIDNVPPSIMFDDISSNSKYNTDMKTVSFIMQDNVSILSTKSVEVLINGVKTDIISSNDKCQFNIHQKDTAQDIIVKCTDNAGNITEMSFNNILVTNDKFQLYRNQIFSIIAVIIAVFGGTAFFVNSSKKKKR